MGSRGENNWGRWGSDDELGARNHLTFDRVHDACHLVKIGQVYSLALPIRRRDVPTQPHRNPALHLMAFDGGDFAAGSKAAGDVQFSDDYLLVAVHGATHIDALSHLWYENVLYNGFSGNTVRSSGARYCDIAKVDWLVGRGVLLDIPGHRGVPHLDRAEAISAKELQKCASDQGTAIGAGDIVLVRTGWLPVFFEDRAKFESGEPGIGADAAEWLASKDIAAIGADNSSVECMPWDQGLVSPAHVTLIRDHGIYMMELLDLEGLAQDHVHEFLFVAAPLKITGGVGSPLNPLAIT